MPSLAVVGAGVIGVAVAWRASAAGWSVTLYDPQPGTGASWVAGGMLAPLSEAWPGEEQVLRFGAAALARWPGFASELAAATGAEVFVADATLTVAMDSADVSDLHTTADFLLAHGHCPGTLDRAAVRGVEPGLARSVRAGLLCADLAIDNRLLLTALRDAVVTAGVRRRAQSVTYLDALEEDQVVVAAGTASTRLWPALPVRPVKGEILRLRRRISAPPPPRRAVRARVHGRPLYLVPRPDGIVVGATEYEAGRDTAVTVAGVRDLIVDAEKVFPGIGDYELAEIGAGSRPATPDNVPLIGRVSDRVVVATGHGRNGLLGAPLTAAAVVALLSGDVLPEAKVADPHRFSQQRQNHDGGGTS